MERASASAGASAVASARVRASASASASENPSSPRASTPPRHTCHLCRATFARQQHLQRHALTHSRALAFECAKCTRQFQRRDALQRHERTHEQTDTSVRQLQGRACSACALKKARCAGGIPCTRCVKRNIECRDALVPKLGAADAMAEGANPPVQTTSSSSSSSSSSSKGLSIQQLLSPATPSQPDQASSNLISLPAMPPEVGGRMDGTVVLAPILPEVTRTLSQPDGRRFVSCSQPCSSAPRPNPHPTHQVWVPVPQQVTFYDETAKVAHEYNTLHLVSGVAQRRDLSTHGDIAMSPTITTSCSEYGQQISLSSPQAAQELQVPSNRINSRVRRMGGAFGGKESRCVPIACMLAIAARKEGRPVRLMLNRDEDMMTTGQRHPFQARWKVGTTNDGKLLALEIDLYNNGGYSQDMSGAVMDRCCTHVDSCYEVPNVWIRGHVCRTNTHSNTAYRGFGGPQGMYIAESILSGVAEGLNIDIDELRRKNLYTEGDLTPFLQKIDEDWHIPTMLKQLADKADYERRKAAVASFNETSKWRKRGICLVPSKFGISFATALHLNQGAAYVKIYADGSVLLHHGGTEMGQGLYTKMCQVCAQELNVPLDSIFTDTTSSYQTVNVSPTAASSGSDLNGMAIKHACDQLNERLEPYREKYGPDAPMKELAHAAYLDRVNLAANGFYKMPKVGFKWGNFEAATNKPMYFYWTQGVACSEVELDLLTGDHTVLRTDIMMDVGQSINPAIDYGQIEGAFVQGQGLFTMEESLWTRTGELFTRGPGTYKIPGFSDIPQQFNVSMLRHDDKGEPLEWKHLKTIQSSKGVGEPPLFLGSTVFFALREAVKAARRMNGVVEGERGFALDSPATAERLRLAVGDRLVEKARVVPREGETNFFVAVA